MPARSIWEDFVSTTPRLGNVKHVHNGKLPNNAVDDTPYARWKCPYCNAIVEARQDQHVLRHKAKECARHFWGAERCKKRPENDLRGWKPPKRPAAACEPARPLPVSFTEPSHAAAPSSCGAPSSTASSTPSTSALTAYDVSDELTMLRVELARQRTRADDWKRLARSYHQGTDVPEPESGDEQEERERKRLCVRAAWRQT